ncbi:MAG: hypothetical protein K6T78_03495 [Alicyclobacillus sp.]|nr:hypothetical protein [Alicyclobacillus sp.]
MSRLDRLRWIPMLVDAYREAKLQVGQRTADPPLGPSVSDSTTTAAPPRWPTARKRKPGPAGIAGEPAISPATGKALRRRHAAGKPTRPFAPAQAEVAKQGSGAAVTQGKEPATAPAGGRPVPATRTKKGRDVGPLAKATSVPNKAPAVDELLAGRQIIRELRTGNRRSWSRLDTIQQKLQDVDAKVESLKEELRRVEHGARDNPPASAATFPRPGLPPWP